MKNDKKMPALWPAHRAFGPCQNFTLAGQKGKRLRLCAWDTPGMERFPEARRVNCGAVHLATYSDGEGPPVIFCHGFPELAYSWRHQLPAIAEAGFHAIAPDMRGYGASDKPNGVEHYDIFHLMSDLDGLL
ncbi:MAG: alpha/beta fold hydrolase, partial [Myxococcota bacterium]